MTINVLPAGSGEGVSPANVGAAGVPPASVGVVGVSLADVSSRTLPRLPNVLPGGSQAANFAAQAISAGGDANNIADLWIAQTQYVVTLLHPVYWDPGQTCTEDGGGSGRWTTSSTAAYWYDPTANNGQGADVAWTDGLDAVFSGAAGTVTISGTVSPASITVETTDYVVTNATSSDGLAFASTGTIDVEAGQAAVNAPLSVTGTLTTTGPGTLEIGGPVAVNGGGLLLNRGTLVNNGTLLVNNVSELDNYHYATLDNEGTLTIDNVFWNDRHAAMSNHGTLALDNGSYSVERVLCRAGQLRHVDHRQRERTGHLPLRHARRRGFACPRDRKCPLSLEHRPVDHRRRGRR